MAHRIRSFTNHILMVSCLTLYSGLSLAKSPFVAFHAPTPLGVAIHKCVHTMHRQPTACLHINHAKISKSMERLGQRIIKNNFVKQTLPSPGLYGHDYEDFVKQQLEIELPTNQNLVNNVSYTITTHEWKRPLQLGELDFMVLDFSTDQLLTVFEAKSMHDPVYMRRAYTKASKQLSRFIGCLGSLHLIPGMNMCFQFEYEEVDLGNPREWDVHKVQPVIILGPVDKAQQHSKKAKRIGHIHPRTLDNPQDNAA